MMLTHSQIPYSELRLGILAEGPSLHVLRRTTEAALRSWGVPALVDDTLIVVNELGTNAAEAAPGDWMELGLRLLPEGVMVELWDSSPDMPPEAGPDELNLLDVDAEGGRGLLVVSAYSAKHGVTQTTGRQGKTVWALCAHDNWPRTPQ